MESTRQSKVAKQIQKDISDIFSKEGADLVERNGAQAKKAGL